MVAYLSKSDASEGFTQIINFLNGSYIKYALTVNLNIYVSCIKQFWTTVAVKQVNDVTRLQALVDNKKVVVTEAIIREALRLDDAEGVDCLPNEELFAELARMSYEKPCLRFTKLSSQASGSRKFKFSKYIFDSLVRNVDSPTKFYMYPHFVQLMIRKQVGDLSTHTTKYTSPALRRVGKWFSGVETPLFESMLVEQQVAEEGDADENDETVNAGEAAEGDVSDAHGEVPTVVQPPSPQPQPHPQQDAEFPMNLFEEVMDTCVALTRRVEHLEFDKVAQALEITKLKRRVKKLERRNKGRMIAEVDADVVLEDVKKAADEAKEVDEDAKVDETQVPAAILTAASTRVAAAPSRRRKGVVIRDPEEEFTTSTIIPAKTKSKDKGKGILVEEPKPLKKKHQIEQDEKYARELHAELNKDIDWDEVIDHVKLKAKEDPVMKKYQALKRKPQTEAQARKNIMMYLKNVVGFKMDYFKVKGWKLVESCGVQIITFTSTQLILLVERKYPLTRFTLDQMLNAVRLEVEEESEVSLELLRFTRQ
nr:hypothetical protein [Tanacetum cinerariifolium]